MRHRPAPKSNKLRMEVKKDPVKAKDFEKLNIMHCCEQCSHFDGDRIVCTIGYNADNHLKQTNLKSFETSGRMAFCRYQEID